MTERRIPPTFYGRIPEAEDRYTLVDSPFVDYVLPNFNSAVMSDLKVPRGARRWRPSRSPGSRPAVARRRSPGRLDRQPVGAGLQAEPGLRGHPRRG